MADQSLSPRSELGRALVNLLHAVASGESDARVMELELLALIEGRRYCYEWVEALRGRAGEDAGAEAAAEATEERPSGANPAQFLRAWGETTARMIQLLKARQELAEREGDAEGLLADLVSFLEESPALRLPEPEPEAVPHG